MMFVIKNRAKFVINTRQNINLHMYQVNLAKYGKGVYHMAVKVLMDFLINLMNVI
jgi:hypothetical protein